MNNFRYTTRSLLCSTPLESFYESEIGVLKFRKAKFDFKACADPSCLVTKVGKYEI